MKSNKVKLVASFLVSAIILYLLYRKVNFPQFLQSLSQVRLVWLLILVPGSLSVTALRGIRWGHLAGWNRGVSGSVKALFISRAGNNILPFRVGDLLRIQFARDEGGVSYSASSAAVLVEMVIDLGFLCLFGILLFALTVSHGEIVLVAVSVALIMAVVLWVLSRDDGEPCHTRGFRALIGRLRKQLRKTLSSQRLPRALLLSLMIWSVSFLSVYGGLRLMLPQVSIAGLLCAVVLIFFTAMVPSAPGFIGTYHASVAGAIVFMGYEFQPLSALPVVMHLSQFIVQVAGGLLVGYGYIFKNDWTKTREGIRSLKATIFGKSG